MKLLLLPQTIPVNFDGIERNILFNLKVTYIIQEHFDLPIVEAIDLVYSKDIELKKKSYENLCYILMEIFNEDTRIYNKNHPENMRVYIDIDYLFERLNNAVANKLMEYVVKAFMETLPDKSEEDTDPNLKSE